MNPLRFFAALVLFALLPGTALTFWGFATRFVHARSLALPLAIGTVAGFFLELFIARVFPAFEVFEHELTHAIAAILLLRPVTEFKARREGGFVQHGGGFGGELGNDFIGLAPYLLPTFTVISVLVRPFLGREWFPWFDGWIGLTFGYHTRSTAAEIRSNWHKSLFARVASGESTRSDIGQRGYVYSAIFISTMTFAIHGLLVAILLRGYHGVPAWLHQVWEATKHLAIAGASFARGLARTAG